MGDDHLVLEKVTINRVVVVRHTIGVVKATVGQTREYAIITLAIGAVFPSALWIAF